MLRLPSLLLILPSLLGCSAADLVNAVVPTAGYRLIAAQPYGDGPRRKLDLYVPDRDGPLPVIVFFYGGSWQRGDRADFRFVGEALASRGYLTVIPDYRVHPEVDYAGLLEDSAEAVAWVEAEAGEVTGRPLGPLFLAGHSAGAYNAMMLTLDRSWLAAEGLAVCARVRGTVGLAGPYDFLPLTSAALKIVFGPEEDRSRTQPINWVRGDAPPLLLITGDADSTVRPRNSTRLAERIRQAGGEATVLRYPGVGHLGLVGALAYGLRWYAPVLDDVDQWIGDRLEQPAPVCP